MAALSAEKVQQDAVFGDEGRGRYVNAVENSDVQGLGSRQPSVQALIDATVADARAVLDTLDVKAARG